MVKLNSDLDEGVGNVQTGAWQHILKERLNIHPCLITQHLDVKKHKCLLCGRRRHCSDEILLFGKKYNHNSLKTDKNAKYELTAEEEAEGYKQYEADDGSIGIQVPIGPTCLQRLLIYHELRLVHSFCTKSNIYIYLGIINCNATMIWEKRWKA